MVLIDKVYAVEAEMKGSRMRIAAVLFVAAVTLSGCGEALYELTTEEQAAIVSYA